MGTKAKRVMRTAWVLGLAGLLTVTAPVAQNTSASGGTGPAESRLGTVVFPTSGSDAAQAHFLRGVAAMHSFWYEEALEAFRAATQAEPEFMMGYWGEAMAHNHPIWHQQDTEAARKVIEKIRDTDKLTARERAYLSAVRILYGKGDKLDRDLAYSAAMEKIYKEHPDDLEAASFYALSLLGTVRPGDKGFRRQMQAGAIAQQVYQKNPNHPGAAHYIIHAFDDPEHAILALPAAYRYAEIAPEAHHARHMPSHIFLQLGMWPEAAASNESSWAASDAWVQRKALPITRRDYHSLQWLAYIYLQQGRYAKAEELLGIMRKTKESNDDDTLRRSYDFMAGTLIVETQQWDRAGQLFQTSGTAPGPRNGKAEDPAHCSAPKTAGERKAPGSKGGKDYVYRSQSVPIFVRGMAAGVKGLAEAKKSVTELRALRKQLTDEGNTYRAKIVEIMELEVTATAFATKGNYHEAIAQMKRATALEEELSPPSGPPDMIKPSHELFGEILLRAGRPKEAAEQFAITLRRQPNRARAWLGAARAAVKSGDRPAAVTAYTHLLQVWNQPDNQAPERREAQAYFDQASAH